VTEGSRLQQIATFDPVAAIPGTFSPSQLPTFVHELATSLQRRWNGGKWDDAVVRLPDAEGQLSGRSGNLRAFAILLQNENLVDSGTGGFNSPLAFDLMCREVVVMLILAALLQSVSSIPPPPADSLAAAAALWAEHPATATQKDLAIRIAVAEEANEALIRIGAGRGSGRGQKAELRYAIASTRLEARLLARVPQDRTGLDREMAECGADGVARALTPGEIAEVRGFMTTELGRRFWDSSALGLLSLKNCYRGILHLVVTDADYRSVGIRPPDPPPAVPHEER